MNSESKSDLHSLNQSATGALKKHDKSTISESSKYKILKSHFLLFVNNFLSEGLILQLLLILINNLFFKNKFFLAYRI